jgi:hypothetical protein
MPRIQRTASAIPPGLEKPPKRNARVDLLDVTQLLLGHLTPALCKAVFKRHRTVERERKWSLYALNRFWMAMIIRQPPSLESGVEETRKGRGRDKLWPRVTAGQTAFSEKSKGQHPRLFRALCEAFTESLLPQAPLTYASWMAGLRKHFPEIIIVDGSQLDEICKRLKILWPIRSPILPGCVTVFYDLFRGMTRKVMFYPNAVEPELSRSQDKLQWMPRGSLLLGDRLYASVRYFHLLVGLGLHGLFRRHGHLKVRRLQALSHRQGDRTLLEDVLVEVGCGGRQPKIVLRLIRYRSHGRSLDLLTDILDLKMLPAEQAVSLYGMRWSIERMFLDLKKTLKLRNLYAAHPNLVAQQFYATTMVYNAFRVAQASIAAQAEVLPEQISSQKLFPKLARCSNDWAVSQLTMLAVCEANPGVRLKEPNWRTMPFAYAILDAILMQRRSSHRRHRRFCLSRFRWKSFAHVPGGPSLLRSVRDG